MQIILATKETKEATLQKKLQEKLIEKRNLFGLGLTSLIAACGADKAAGGSGGGGDNGGGPGDPDTLPFKAAALTEAQANGYSADKSGGADSLTVEVKEAEATKATLTFSDGTADSANAGIYKLTTTENQYDLVISSNVIPAGDFNGGIFIFWNVAGIKNETIGADSTTNQRLEIKGAKRGDNIGTHPSDFLKIGGTDNKYDMVIREGLVDKGGEGAKTNEGAIYILWDIVDYAEATKTIDLGKLNEVDPVTGGLGLGATAGSLAIYGTTTASAVTANSAIGTHAPEFLQIGGAGNNYDMVIRSHLVDESATTAGAIYVLWDIEDYYKDTDEKIVNKVIDFDQLGNNNGDPNLNATAGSLAIYGARGKDNVGIHVPDFLQIAGTDNNYDMVIRSHAVDKLGGSSAYNDEQGAIYILWDINDYYGVQGNPNNKEINLGADNNNNNFYATSGLLSIYGAINNDYIGSYAPEFLQIGGREGANKLDMVIRSEYVNKTPDLASTDTGAIYVLWDVADYAGGNETINLTSLSSDASSGLLTIYGREDTANLGSNANNILYDADGALTNIDGDGAGTIDIAFRDGSHTYVLFGDKVAEVDGTTQKVTSKTIDLANISDLSSSGDSYFGYNFGSGNIENVGYRFNGRKADLAAVQTAFPNPPAPLSDADADLGVWDIA